MTLKFRKRNSTRYLYIIHRDMEGKTFDEVYRYFVQRGELGTGYHFYVDTFGNISEDRHLEEIAGWNYKDNETSIYILVDCPKGNTNDSQQYVVNQMITKIKADYADIEIVTLN